MSKSQCPSTPTLVTLLSACNRFMRMAAGRYFYTSLHIRPKHTSSRLGTQPTSRRNTPVLHRFSNLDVGSTTLFLFQVNFSDPNLSLASWFHDHGAWDCTYKFSFNQVDSFSHLIPFLGSPQGRTDLTSSYMVNWHCCILDLLLLRKSTSTPTAANTQRLQTPIPLACQCMPKVISPLQNPEIILACSH